MCIRVCVCKPSTMYKGLPHLHRPKKEPIPLRLPVLQLGRHVRSLARHWREGNMWSHWRPMEMGSPTLTIADCVNLTEDHFRHLMISISTFKNFPAYGSLYGSEALAPPSWHIHP